MQTVPSRWHTIKNAALFYDQREYYVEGITACGSDKANTEAYLKT